MKATYDYQDAGGTLRFQVCRIESNGEKRFFQRRPAPDGGWISNRDGVAPIPYRLPDLLAADQSATVYVAEGEKDVDALRALGLVATCNPGGAGKWDPGFNSWLGDRPVVVLADNDEAGSRHANDVTRSLWETRTCR